MATDKLDDVISHSPEETLAFGRKLARLLQPPCAVLLEGELGSGKTTLTKGIVAGLGAAREEDVTSPTFTLVHEYANNQAADTGVRVCHVDLYRIERRSDIESLGLDELFNARSTVIIEWGDKLPDQPPVPLFRIRLQAVGHSEFDRNIVVEKQERVAP
ncbi:MAG TPA: tRNA (adenosine(37)-N6)-threonylcarbamoyltransferase complex ATPase subunit type 1 TsaE [Terriglobia bacterium]|nr:tRNA (adenosine(37)-N6)-threonylcarbamoyltransferase complex ATPase subunit type 1 TsaE [Terriglobia bacterium]